MFMKILANKRVFVRSLFLILPFLAHQPSASAQNLDIPDENDFLDAVDPLGVVLSTQKIDLSIMTVKLGEMSPELNYRLRTDHINGYGINILGYLKLRNGTGSSSDCSHYNDFSVSIDGTTEVFWLDTSQDIIRPDDDRSKSKLVGDFTNKKFIFTDGAGTVAEFSILKTAEYNTCYARLSSLTRPNGEISKYLYGTSGNSAYVRNPYAIKFNTGYQIRIFYEGYFITKVALFRDAYHYCGDLDEVCSIPSTWPSMNIDILDGYTNSGVFYPTKRQISSAGQRSVIIDSSGPVGIKVNWGFGKEWTYGTQSINGTSSFAVSNGLGWYVKYDTKPAEVGCFKKLEKIQADGAKEVFCRTSSDHHTFNKYISPDNYTSLFSSDDYIRYDEKHFPEGNIKSLIYDSRGNITETREKAKPGSNLPDLVETTVYPVTCTAPKTCNKPTSITDARGAVTNFTYDPTHGGILSEMGPAPDAGAARPLKLTTWVQQYAWTKDASGTLVQAATPIWVKASETQCQTAAGSSVTSCDGAAVQTVTTYEYGAGGTAESLLVKGVAVASGGTTLRTCYQYDIYARKIAETAPTANLGVCS